MRKQGRKPLRHKDWNEGMMERNNEEMKEGRKEMIYGKEVRREGRKNGLKRRKIF